MTETRRDNGNHGFTAPVALIVILMCGYWVISDWHSLPGLIDEALAVIR